MKKDLSSPLLSKESNAESKITLSITLSDLLVISSYFIGFSCEIVRYVCPLKEVEVSYSKYVSSEILKERKILKEKKILGRYAHDQLKEVSFSNHKNNDGRFLKFCTHAEKFYFVMELEVIEFLVNNCIKNNYLPRSNFLVLINTNIGIIKDKNLYKSNKNNNLSNKVWNPTDLFINFSSFKRNPLSYYLAFIEEADLACDTNKPEWEFEFNE